MKRIEIRKMIDQIYAEMPGFLKEERYRGRAAFELQVRANDHLPLNLSSRQREAALEFVEMEVALKFGIERSKADLTKNVTSQVGPKGPSSEIALWRDLEMRIERCFPSTTDGTLDAANGKAQLAKASLKAFLNEHCPRIRLNRWQMRARLKAKAEALIEQLRAEDIF